VLGADFKKKTHTTIAKNWMGFKANMKLEIISLNKERLEIVMDQLLWRSLHC
jgi:hypothetical protein